MANELQAIKKELIELKEKSTNDRVKNLLQNEIYKVDNELAEISNKQTSNEGPKAHTKATVDIKEHAFDESDKFIKIFLPFDAANIKDDDVELKLSENSFSLIIQTPNKNHQFVATSLLKSIDCAKSYKKIKPDMISVYLKKAKEGETWGYLTTTEKKLKDSKTKMFEKTDDEESTDPGSQLMTLMKKMYETGDPEMKKTIAKAWTEGQMKQKEFPM